MQSLKNAKIPEAQGATRVLFLCWGYSIHAWRRINIFIEDESFKVAVVSTYNYNFKNAQNYILPAFNDNEVQQLPDASERIEKENLRNRIFSFKKHITRILKFIPVLLRVQLKIFPYILFDSKILEVLKKDIKCMFRHYGILQSSIKEFKPDVVFLQTLLYPGYLSYFLPESLPIMITFWNGDVTWWAMWNGIEKLLKKKITTYGVRRASAISVNSQTAFDACLEYGAKKQDVHLIRYPGVDVSRFNKMPSQAAKEKIGLPAHIIILWPRGLGGYLNSDIFINAAALIEKQIKGVIFLVLCSASSAEEIEKHKKMTIELGINESFVWREKVIHDEMPFYYSSSDVVVSISSNDSLPNCMLEAMACGIPVIMGDIPQIREWIINGENGYLVPPRDPAYLAETMLKLLNSNDESRDYITSNGLDLVRQNADSRKNAILIKDLTHRVALQRNIKE